MGVPSSMDLLRVWETSQHQSSAYQALQLLAAAHPDQGWETLAQLSVGQRDGLLLALRQQLFGPQLACVADCPTCQDQAEITLKVADLQLPTPPVSLPLTLSVEGYEVQFRLPTGGDLVVIATATNPDQAQQTLLNRCLISVHHQGNIVTDTPLPSTVLDRLIATIADMDPQADIRLNLTCPNCHHGWQLSFDIASFLQREIQTWAYRLLQDVHCLARAYGWSEAEIVAMTPQRRHLYVEMASHG